jgi:beta-lactam-binding protein with PASTA domain
MHWKLRRYFRPLLGALVLAAIALVSAIFTMRGAIHGDEVAVPNLDGLSLSEAENKTASLRLGLDVENRYFSAIVPIGRVMAQSPAAGTVVRREWHVRVAESLGPQQVAIPDVMGQPLRMAAITIQRLGLELGSVVHLAGTGNVADIVIAQTPPPTATGADSPRVGLLLSQPEAATVPAWVMPDLTGISYAAAAAAVNRAGLRLGPVDAAAQNIPSVSMNGALNAVHATAAPGTVMAQSPAAGERVTDADVVRLTVAR